MNYLLDTNIWLELMLDQERAADIADLLTRVPSDQLCLTDFSLHSIGVILTRLKQSHIFIRFVQDVLIDGSALLVTVPPNEAAALSIPPKNSIWTSMTHTNTSPPNATT